MNKLRHYWSSLEAHDIVNVKLMDADGNMSAESQRARVVALESTGIRIRLGDSNEEHLVQKEQVQQRVTLPWKPRDLADYFIIFRRKHGREEEYVEDLRVRRNVIKRILKLLTCKGEFRPNQGIESRHYYYTACEYMSDQEIDELLPEEDYVPADLNFQDNDENMPHRSIDVHTFVQ